MTIGILTLNSENKKAYIGKKFFSHATIFILTGFLLISNVIAVGYANLTGKNTNQTIFGLFLIIGIFGLMLFAFGLASLVRSLIEILFYL